MLFFEVYFSYIKLKLVLFPNFAKSHVCDHTSFAIFIRNVIVNKSLTYKNIHTDLDLGLVLIFGKFMSCYNIIEKKLKLLAR